MITLRHFLSIAFFIALNSLCGAAHANDSSARTLGIPPRLEVSKTPQVALGRKLFFDKRLSASGDIGCASCHQPSHAYADNSPLAHGINGAVGTRHTPSLLNVGFGRTFFWDGRRSNLEEQVLDPFVNPVEHGLIDHADLLVKVIADPEYIEAFQAAYPGKPFQPTISMVAQALASFLRSLVAGNSAFDRYYFGGQGDALSPAASRGFRFFRGPAGCAECHTVSERYALFTDHQFHSLGIGFEQIADQLPTLTEKVKSMNAQEVGRLVLADRNIAALGRFIATGDPSDIGKFKTPSLRNVALTAPYMHDGSIETLEEALDRELYYRGLTKGRPILLTQDERADLVEFLKALTGLEIE